MLDLGGTIQDPFQAFSCSLTTKENWQGLDRRVAGLGGLGMSVSLLLALSWEKGT